MHADVINQECKTSSDIIIITDNKKGVQDALKALSKFPSDAYKVIEKITVIKKSKVVTTSLKERC